MANPVETTIEGTGGKLFVRIWRPETKPRAVVAICHGFNSHSGYYGWAAEQLVAANYAAYAVDLRGRGKSDGERFYINDISEYESDVGALVKFAKGKEPGLPVFLLGHSAGGVTSCIYTLDHQSEILGLICQSFAYRTPAPDFAVAALKGLAHVAPHAHVLHLANAYFSRDPAAVAKMDADPLIAHETQPTRTVAALAHADDRLKKEFPKFTLPLLIQHGSSDQVTKYQGSQDFYERASSKDKTLKVYEGHYHDLLNDIGKEQVMGDILSWLNAHL